MNSQSLEAIWNQVPENYYETVTATNPVKRLWHTTKLRNFRTLTKDMWPHSILDVGCASGRMANEVSKIYPSANITAIDVYKKSVQFGKKHYPHIKFQVADAHKLPYRANSYDLVMCYEVIEHLENPLVALKEMRRVLKKNGHALIVMDSGSKLFRVVWFIAEHTVCRVWLGAHLHPYTHRELQRVIKKAGFKIKKKHFSHFGMEVSFLLTK